MRIRPIVSLAFLLAVNACGPAAPATPAAADGPGKPDAGSPVGEGGTPAPSGVKSSCAAADVLIAPPQLTAIREKGYVKNIVSADFNRDGKTDIAVLEGGSSPGVEVFLSNGDGTFGKGVFYDDSVGNGFAMTAADFNGDGIPDVLYGVFPSGESVDRSVALRLGKADGTLEAAKITSIGASNLLQLSPADLNGDGKMDFAFAANENPSVSGTVLNSGGGAFAGPNPALDVQSGWVVGDVNGDGAADVLLPQRDGFGVCVLMNNGSGQFAAPACTPVTSVHGERIDRTAIGDINGDGTPDIVAIYDGSQGLLDSSNISVFLGKGQGKFGDRIPAILSSNMLAVTIADVNNDGKADFVAFSSSSDATSLVDVLVSNGDGTFATKPLEYAAGRNQGGADHPLLVADYAGNGLRGIVVQNSAKNGFDVLMASCKK